MASTPHMVRVFWPTSRHRQRYVEVSIRINISTTCLEIGAAIRIGRNPNLFLGAGLLRSSKRNAYPSGKPDSQHSTLQKYQLRWTETEILERLTHSEIQSNKNLKREKNLKPKMEDQTNTYPLPSTMLSSRFSTHHEINLSHTPVPTPSPTQVLLQISWCGICGTDLHEFCAGPLVAPRPETPHPITKESIPITLGHEFTGTVVQAAKEGGKGLKVGDKVIVDPRINCGGRCFACKNGVTNLCDSWGFVGLSGGGGGFAEFCAVEEKMCHLLPGDVELGEATLIEPLAVARHALTVSGFERFEGLDVLVVGGGPIGLAVLWNLKAVGGARRVVVSEPAEGRRRHCEKLADLVVDPREGRIGEICRSKTGGKGVDVVFDCAGIPAGLKDGMDALRVKGTWVNVAGWEVPVSFHPNITKNEDFPAVLMFFALHHSSKSPSPSP